MSAAGAEEEKKARVQPPTHWLAMFTMRAGWHKVAVPRETTWALDCASRIEATDPQKASMQF